MINQPFSYGGVTTNLAYVHVSTAKFDEVVTAVEVNEGDQPSVTI